MVQHDYNKFYGFSDLSYNIISHLILNDEMIWKLIKFPTNDAHTKADLTIAEKATLIYKGQSDSTPFRVFTVPFVDDSFEEEQTQLRVFTHRVDPRSYVVATVDFAIDIMCHNKIAILSTAKNRVDLMFEHVMGALNGRDIKSVGNLYFNAQQSPRNRCDLIYFNKYYQGFRIIMSTNIG